MMGAMLREKREQKQDKPKKKKNEIPESKLGFPQSDIGPHRIPQRGEADYRRNSTQSLMNPDGLRC